MITKTVAETMNAAQTATPMAETAKPRKYSPAPAPPANVLGPVEDLESYVKADWWMHLFNANYLRTDGDVVSDSDITKREVDRFLKVMSPREDSSILDLCCGQGRHVLELARRGYTKVGGLDRSPYLIRRARQTRKREGLQADFKEGDARQLPYRADTFDYVLIAGNSFGYFETAEEDMRVLDEVRRVLRDGGQIIIDMTDGEHMRSSFEPRSWEWIDRNYFVCRERSLSRDGERLVSREVITHVGKGVVADQFYAERLYSRKDIQSLLAMAGFQMIRIVDQIEGESTRNQDLGMMGNRLLVTGRLRKDPALAASPRPIRKVAVLLGDPNRQDIVKPNGTFDEDDHATINSLREALATMDRFEFTFLDDHESYLDGVAALRGGGSDLVFNLCDEGFQNDPSKELHVPALLEMLGLPYTGGTPQCLAFCYDKSLVRGIAAEMGIPVPAAYLIGPADTTHFLVDLPFPVIVKPNFGDSSFGITAENVCHDLQQLENAITRTREATGYERPILIEELLTGQDITVGIIGNPPGNCLELPIIAEDYSCLPEGLPHICGYEAKWDPSSPYWKIKSVPADLPEATEQFLRASCNKLFERLGCRDYARFDWRLDNNGTPRLLEANPNPGWCWDGHLAKAAQHIGIRYAEMLNLILDAAVERIETEAQRQAM
jgi:D-alanine-D-alanine ligase